MVFAQESDVSSALNPAFFHPFIFRSMTLPGPSQLVVQLRDGVVEGGAIKDRSILRIVFEISDHLLPSDDSLVSESLVSLPRLLFPFFSHTLSSFSISGNQILFKFTIDVSVSK